MCWILLTFTLCPINSKGNENSFTCDWTIIFIKLNFHSLPIGCTNSTATSSTERNRHNPIDISQHDRDANTWGREGNTSAGHRVAAVLNSPSHSWRQTNYFIKGWRKTEYDCAKEAASSNRMMTGRGIRKAWVSILASIYQPLQPWTCLPQAANDQCMYRAQHSKFVCCFHFPTSIHCWDANPRTN